MSDWKKDALEFIIAKTKLNNERIGVNYPHASHNKKYIMEKKEWWTAGFWPGILWSVYIMTKDENLKNTAISIENDMEDILYDCEKVDHDLGFMWTLSSTAHYKITNDLNSRRRSLLAANLLIARFNPVGKYIRAWNSWNENDENSGVAIIDCLMNLPLLHFAAIESKDIRFDEVYKMHVDNVIRNFVREDGSVYHMVMFDPRTGEVIKKCAGQGYSTESSWARGTAWAVYGLALAYKNLKDTKILSYAKRCANYFIANTIDTICPLWDFRLPKDSEKIKYRYLDSSAGAIASCGLLLLSELVPKEEKEIYQSSGERILKNLYIDCGTYDDIEEEGLLKHGTGHFPEQKNLDVPLIYGDYFFVEGILRLNNENLCFW